jgi:RNA polymerase sigma-70 factor (ECF subfamily)
MRHLAHAARADLQRRLGITEATRVSYQRSLELARQPAKVCFLERRLEQLTT